MNSPAVSENLRSALSAAVDRELELALASCPAFAPSAGFGERMEKLIREEKRPVRRLLNSRVKRAAAALIAAAMMLCFLGFTSERIRSSVAGFFVQVFGDHTEYSDPAITKTSIEEEYGLVPVPEGFEERDTIREECFSSTTYTKGEDTAIILIQQAGDSISEFVDNEHGTVQEYRIDGKNVRISLAEHYAHAAWIENGYYFSLTFTSTSPFDIDQIIGLASSIAVK